MSDVVIRVENVSKQYRLGLIGSRTLRDDVDRLVARLRGQADPLLKIGQQDHGNRQGELIWALRDVSFQVKQGEVLGIIGRNGAGKSTLLKLLSRITEPTEGWADIHGRVGSLLEVGTGFHPELTGRENIYLNGAILGMKKAEIERKFDEIVAFAEAEKFAVNQKEWAIRWTAAASSSLRARRMARRVSSDNWRRRQGEHAMDDSYSLLNTAVGCVDPDGQPAAQGLDDPFEEG